MDKNLSMPKPIRSRMTSSKKTYTASGHVIITTGLANLQTDILPLREIDAKLIITFSNSPMASYIECYDLNFASFIGNKFFFRYITPQQCRFIEVSLVDKVNPNELEFRVLFTLIGLSSPGRIAFSANVNHGSLALLNHSDL